MSEQQSVNEVEEDSSSASAALLKTDSHSDIGHEDRGVSHSNRNAAGAAVGAFAGSSDDEEDYDTEEEELRRELSRKESDLLSSGGGGGLSSSSVWFLCELNEMKDAVRMATNRYTFLAAFVAFLVSYFSLVGLGPWVGPVAGPWLEKRGYGTYAGPWAHSPDSGLLGGGGGGHVTKHTSEGTLRSSLNMDQFAKQVRVLPALNEVSRLKRDLTHLRSSFSGWLVEDEVHDQDDDGGSTTPLFYSPTPRTVVSNVTIGMNMATHPVHGHAHTRWWCHLAERS
jgi:hypothetical protein